VRVQLDGLPLADFQPYVAAGGLPITLATGALSVAGRLELATAEEGGTSLLLKEGEVRLQDLAMLRNDTQKGFFRLGTLALADVSVDVDGRRLEAGQLLLQEPDLSLRRDRQGIIDLTQLQPAASGRAAGPSGAAPARPWQVRLAELQLDNGQVAVALEGARETSRAVFYRLTGSVTGFDSATRTLLTVTLRGREKQGGSLAVNGQVTLNPLELNGRLRTDKLNLKPFSPLLGQIHPDLRLGSGTLSLSLQASLKNRAGRSRLRIRGQSVLESLSLLDGKQEFAALRTLRVPELDLQPDGRHYAAGLVTLTRPHVNLIVTEDGVSNLARLFGQEEAAPTDADADTDAGAEAGADVDRPDGDQEPQATSYLRLGGVRISEGRLLLRDERYQPAVDNRLDKLAVTVGEVDNAPDSRASVDFSAELDGAPLEGKGELNPLRTDMFADVQARLAALDLTPLSPMSERFIAYPLQKGVFSLDSRISIDRGQLDSSHRIELDGLALGDKVKSPDAPDLPVKLGIKLLRDPAGNINLTLPVSGDLRDPSFSVGGLVFKVIANLLIKAVTSPFMFLGGLLGGDGQGLEFIVFDPGEGRLLASHAESLPTIADMLMERPEIHLVLEPAADEEDRAQLADAYVHRRMQELKYASLPEQERARVKAQELPVGPEVDADEYADLLFEVYADQPFDKPRNLFGMVRRLPPQEMMEQIREHHPRDDAALKQLALERAGHLQAAFLALRPELEGRISIGEPQVPGEGHRVTFGIR
jgi:hypothetical protein